MHKIYLAGLHKIWLSHKILFKLFWKDLINIKDTNKLDYKYIFNNLNTLEFKWKNIRKTVIEKIFKERETIDLDEIKKIIKKLNIKIIDYFHKDYPEILREIPNPPFIIYSRWTLRTDPNNSISIVWSRTPSDIAIKSLKYIIKDLVNKDLNIISWWAYWIDSLSHRIAIENSWYTLSVFWTWIDRCYPKTNKALFESILEKWWWLMSIFPLWTSADTYNFPIRNEIVAWLSKWVLIWEAEERSWTLITARLALELNREVFVIPYDIFNHKAIWSNYLIKDGLWKCINDTDDILQDYNISYSNDLEKNSKKNSKQAFKKDNNKKINNISNTLKKEKQLKKEIKLPENTNQNKICKSILEWINIPDNIAENIDMDILLVQQELTMLEIEWYIEKWESWTYKFKN